MSKCEVRIFSACKLVSDQWPWCHVVPADIFGCRLQDLKACSDHNHDAFWVASLCTFTIVLVIDTLANIMLHVVSATGKS